ncbi:AIM24 family protein [Kurthia sibirica]|uniref:AIM24 family protein n=1 Tax=Kurthia sibirica TaxID=202750 RepID=A0A2U3APR9_9BACL|nr:AIM24 family protein [Kurthia sibirica]PWI26527.1 hypothetical protein DEX24_01815 [Kurthia sibirica]GEK32771.1 hypothetical protein KSI01_03040 [Kurthia sibirica]
MSNYSLDDFLKETQEDATKNSFFELETERVLEVNLDGQVWAKMGSMISYTGNIKFEREKVLEHGLGKMFKKAFTGEGTALMKATGEGKLYLADQGKKIVIFDLEQDSISVNGNNLLAFEPSVNWDIRLMRKMAGIASGGLFNVLLDGQGKVAITTHFEPLTIRVTSENPILTDPNATVAWSGNLKPEFKTDISLRTFIGRGSGESIQMEFSGEGFVIVQPFEEVYRTTGG